MERKENKQGKRNKCESHKAEENCIFCNKHEEKISTIEILNRALYHKYSSSQNYYYTKEIDYFVEGKSRKFWINFIDQNDYLNIEEFLCDIYSEKEVFEQLKMFLEYYKYHSEIPRLEMNKIGDLVMDYHDSKRRLEYQKLKKMLNKPLKKPKIIHPEVVENPLLDDLLILTKRDKIQEQKDSMTLEELARLMGGVSTTVNFRNLPIHNRKISVGSSNQNIEESAKCLGSPKKIGVQNSPKTSEIPKKPLKPKRVKTISMVDFDKCKIESVNLKTSSIIETLKTSGLTNSESKKIGGHTYSSSNILASVKPHKKNTKSEQGLFYKKIENLLKNKDLHERKSLCQKSLSKMTSKKVSMDSEKDTYTKNAHHKTISLPSKELVSINSMKKSLEKPKPPKNVKTLSLISNPSLNFSKQKFQKSKSNFAFSDHKSMEKLSTKISLIKNLIAKEQLFKGDTIDKSLSPKSTQSQKMFKKEISTKSSSNRDNPVHFPAGKGFASKILSFLTDGNSSTKNSKSNLSWNKIKDDTSHLIKDLLAKYRK